ncbi:MAG: hypothetical protein MUW56_19770 [Chryseobacterium sp.]|uniref:hypothetical protein n=1 Tax=Chryseobacterium sp. TaxID=1871047 RepID=UPI0025BB0142|nr:hypothetical protein [Chryseobacterium sp.]MCJ7935799.1 hypothetical protein [Chryseobacterium sp.]
MGSFLSHIQTEKSIGGTFIKYEFLSVGIHYRKPDGCLRTITMLPGNNVRGLPSTVPFQVPTH